MSRAVLVIDNGADSIKVGRGDEDKPRIFPNLYARSKRKHKQNFIGPEIEAVRDPSSLVYRRPFDKGYPINWELQQQIWDFIFGANCLKIKPKEHDLVITEPVMCPRSLAKVCDEVVFEAYEVPALCKATPPRLALHHCQRLPASHTVLSSPSSNSVQPRAAKRPRIEYPSSIQTAIEEANNIANGIGAGGQLMMGSGGVGVSMSSPGFMVVDCGYSFTHCVPFFDNHPINYGIKRVNVAGKVLTNYLKELVSFRHYNVMDETHLMSCVKEKVSMISLDYINDLKRAREKGKRNPFYVEYVLPDYVSSRTGYIRGGAEDPARGKPETGDGGSSDQTLNLTNERIIVPEALFRPCDVGIEQAGISEAIVQSIQTVHRDLHRPLYANILLTGGSTTIPGFRERLLHEVRALAPTDVDVNIISPADPVNSAWKGGSLLGRQPNFAKLCVTRREYEEYGSDICWLRFGGLL